MITSLWRAVPVVAVALVGAVLLGAAPASAHTELATSAPTDGEVLAAAPEEVTLTFTGEIQAGYVQVAVTGADGASLNVGPATVEGPLVRQPVQAGADGPYVVAYRVVSVDGHPITGQLTFTLTGSEADQGAGTTAASESSGPTTPPTPAGRSALAADDSGLAWWAFGALAVLLVASGLLPFLRLRRKRR